MRASCGVSSLHHWVLLGIFPAQLSDGDSPQGGQPMRYAAGVLSLHHWACSVSFPLCHPRGTASPAWVGRRSVYGQHLFLGSIQHLHFIHHESYIVSFETFCRNVYSQCIFAYFFGVQPFLCIYVRTSLFFFAILLITIIDVQSERGYNSFINLPSPVTWETRKGE